MIIDEAIRILKLSNADLAYETQKEKAQAKKLGIEALKRIQRQRKDLLPHERILLPGETEK